MRKSVLVSLVLLMVGSISSGQTITQEIIWDQEKEFNNLKNKPPRALPDYIQISQFAQTLGKNCEDYGYDQKSGGRQDLYRRLSLIYYSYAAHYAQLAIDKFNSESMVKKKSEACARANNMYRVLKKPKRIFDKRFIDACDLLSNEEETVDKEESKEKEDTESSDDEKRITFRTGDAVFSVKVPSPLVAVTVFGTEVTTQTPMEISKMLKEYEQFGFTTSTANSFGIKGYQISFGLDVQQRTKLTEKIYKSAGGFSKTKNARTFSLGDENYDLGPYDARLTYDWEWEIDGPIQAKEDLMATISIKFKTEGFFCDFTVGVRNLDQLKIQKKVMRLVRSFKVESFSAPVTKCKDGDYKMLKQGIPVTWTIYDRSRPSSIVQQPVLARDHEIAAAAANYTGAIVEVIKTLKDARQLTKIPRNVLIEGDMKKAMAAMGGWYLEGYHKVEFIPVEIEEYTELTIDGSLTNAVTFYLEALRDVNAGLSKLGKRMNNMSLRVYWEIPTIEIKGECIPRMVCDNGKWKPDREYMEFREISRKKGTLRAPNKDFMTLKQVEDDLQRYYYDKLDELEADEINYRNVAGRCDESKKQLWKIDFPVNIDQCPTIEYNIQQKQHEILSLTQIQKKLDTELKEWLTKLLPAEKGRLNERLMDILADIRAKEGEIPRLETLRDNYLKNNLEGKAAQIGTQIKFLKEDIELLRGFKLKSNKELQKISSGKKEAEMNKNIAKIQDQVSKLKKDKESLKKQLQACIKETEKIR